VPRRHICTDISDEHFEYFNACARIRNIALGPLFGRLLAEIGKSQLVLPILDDGSKRVRRGVGEHRYSEPRK
jgi:hypothetical protein